MDEMIERNCDSRRIIRIPHVVLGNDSLGPGGRKRRDHQEENQAKLQFHRGVQKRHVPGMKLNKSRR